MIYSLIGYRACPELLSAPCSESGPIRSSAARLVASSRATPTWRQAVGVPLAVVDERPNRTCFLRASGRYSNFFVVQGLRNREIGKLLFIEESTVKAHTHHIYDKLGTRSRTSPDRSGDA